MKKRRMIIALACVLLAAAIGITAYAAVSAKNRTREMQKYDPSCNVHSNTQVVHHRVRKMQKYDPNCKAATDYYGYIKENEKSLSEQKKLVPPVYPEEDLLFDANYIFLARDFGFYDGLNIGSMTIRPTLAVYPDAAIRERDEHSSYVMYDTDTGYRLYLQLSDVNRMFLPVGVAVVVKDKLSHDDFSAIQVGDTIAAVEAIDSTATIMRRFVDSATGYDPASVELYDADGYPITTVHYLTDGLLKIEYGQMTENREPVITNIEFSEDYKMTDALGREVNYKIFDNDLPW